MCNTGSTLDVKKSSYKKLSKLLSAFEKKGVLKTKLVHKQEHVSHVRRDSPLLQSLPECSGDTQAAADAAAQAATAINTKVEMSTVYKVPAGMRPLVGPSADRDALLSPDDVFAAVVGYAQRHGLAEADGDSVKLDSFLATTLFARGEGVMLGAWTCVLW